MIQPIPNGSTQVLHVAEVAKGVILRWPDLPWKSTDLLRTNGATLASLTPPTSDQVRSTGTVG
jgi:hypothetical protein